MKAVAAMDLNRVIGYKGQIPWHLKDDMKWFKKFTLQCQHLVMGNTTFKSIGSKPLPGRGIWVLTNNQDLCIPKHKWNSVHDKKYGYSYFTYLTYLDLLSEFEYFKTINFDYALNNICVCGGAKIYELFMPLITEIYITIVLEEYEGDAFMPEFEDQFPNSELIKDEKEYWLVRYWK